MAAEPLDHLNAALTGRYVVERALGSGGMATVFVARDLRHDRPVALKILRPEVAAALGPDRFLREIALVARLHHPHILPLYDSGELVDPRPGNEGATTLFFVMPLVTGESLRQRIDRERQLPIDDALRITRQVAAALEYAHGQGVIHRDVKPENILLHEGQALIADFGIALAPAGTMGDRLTTPGVVVGTPVYMSPEQAVGEWALDPRSDVYSLGCVLYEMLTGQPPFTGPTPLAVLSRRIAEPAPPARRLRPAVPYAVERALALALAREPADRFASVAAFATQLEPAAAAAQQRPRSVAVLPFLSLSTDPENEFFADGITEDIIANLTKVRALDVISRTSVLPFRKREQGIREIAERLNVATVLDGSVRRAGNRARIVAQLVDAATERQLWAETYDRQLTDIFAIQTDVALQIVAALQTELSPDERSRLRAPATVDFAAYELYLRGRQAFMHFSPTEMRRAIDLFTAAVEHDPAYALAHASAAQAWIELGEGGKVPPLEAYANAREAIGEALAVDPQLGEAHTIAAYLAYVADFDWAAAEAGFKRALALNPGHADTYDYYGRLLLTLERYDEAIDILVRARQLDPLVSRSDLVTALLRAGRLDEAVAAALPQIAADPTYPRLRATLGWAYLKQGRRDEGLAELEAAVELSPGDTLWLAQLGQAYALEGKPDRARDILERLQALSRETYVSPYHLAYVLTGLGEADAAIDLLERAYEERAGAIYGIKGSFLFTPLRSHPRFQALLRKMHFT